MMRRVGTGCLLLALSTVGLLERPLGAQESDFAFHQIRPDIYLAVGTGRVVVGANAAIIMNEHEVLLVDSHITPAAARAALDDVGVDPRRIAVRAVRADSVKLRVASGSPRLEGSDAALSRRP